MAKDNTPTTATPEAPADLVMEPGQFNPFANALLSVAQRLQTDKERIMEQIDANRKGLRSLRTQELMDAEQSAAVEAFYPTRERKPKSGTPAAA